MFNKQQICFFRWIETSLNKKSAAKRSSPYKVSYYCLPKATEIKPVKLEIGHGDGNTSPYFECFLKETFGRFYLRFIEVEVSLEVIEHLLSRQMAAWELELGISSRAGRAVCAAPLVMKARLLGVGNSEKFKGKTFAFKSCDKKVKKADYLPEK